MAYKHILVAYDGSDLAKTALEQAVCMVKEQPATKLTVLHAVHYPNMIVGEAYFNALPVMETEYNEYEALLLEEVEQSIKGLASAEVEVRRGFPVETILECAEEKGCDLIIMGSRGLSGLKEFVLGSVSHSVVQKAKVAVQIIKRPAAKGLQR